MTAVFLDEGNPTLVLRNTLFDIKIERLPYLYFLLLIKAWDKWREGTTVKLLKFPPNEQFPDAI